MNAPNNPASPCEHEYKSNVCQKCFYVLCDTAPLNENESEKLPPNVIWNMRKPDQKPVSSLEKVDDIRFDEIIHQIREMTADYGVDEILKYIKENV